ncbi:MAG: hypothetical protein K6253_02985, partial [Candidatus Liberibacter asiaticus]|nr:hypothetical protein [Candidatus Liberibacter asiaticus]
HVWIFHLQIMILAFAPTVIIPIILLMFVGRNMAIQNSTNLSKLNEKRNLVRLLFLPLRILT